MSSLTPVGLLHKHMIQNNASVTYLLIVCPDVGGHVGKGGQHGPDSCSSSHSR